MGFFESLDQFLKEIGKLTNTVINAVETEDELGTVLRVHWLVEKLLVEYLKTKRKGEIGSIVREPRDFGMKLSLATAFGIPLPIAKVMYQINVIRNKLAHAKSTNIEDGDLKELVRLINLISEIGVEFTPVENRYLEMPVKRPGERLAFGEHGNRVDFVIACITFYVAFIRWYPTSVIEVA